MPPITLTVDMAQRQRIQIGATGLAGLAQEIRMVLATRKGSVPLDRDFGLSWDHVDRPMGEAMQYMVAEASSWSAMCRASGCGTSRFPATTRWRASSSPA